jgi:hypothetical protein
LQCFGIIAIMQLTWGTVLGREGLRSPLAARHGRVSKS